MSYNFFLLFQRILIKLICRSAGIQHSCIALRFKSNVLWIKNINSLRTAYNKGADVHYLVFGIAKQGIDEEINSGVFLKIDDKTRCAKGIMIIDFEKRFSHSVAERVPIDWAEFLVPA